LIIENITGKKFHEVMHEFIFEPLEMKHAYLHGFSKPEVESAYPTAKLYFEDVNLLTLEGVHQIDYAGGSVVAPLAEFLIFMKALINQKLIKNETLKRMVNDDVKKGFPTIGFKYGYSIWKMMPIPLFIPKTFYSWGCVGITGAFMFFHPSTKSYIAGTFNDSSYKGKALRFMASKVIKELSRAQ
jgi:D-alanyl-D-alanine carboxypeptidase